MIPVTFPSSLSSGNVRQMVVYVISPTATQMRWVDYIPIKFATPDLTQENTYEINGYIAVDVIENVSNKQAWLDYIPVVIDSTATDAYTVSLTGYIPAAYAGGAVQSFNFADGLNALSSKITFSRSSNGTVINSSGLISYAPHNLLTDSETFETTSWSKGRAAITANTTIAPNGSTTADSFIEDTTAGNSHLISRILGNPLTANNYIFSVYFKANGRNNVILRLDRDPAGTITRYEVNFNLSTGTIGAVGVNVPIYSIESVGNGWYKCSIGCSLATSLRLDFSAYLWTSNTVPANPTYNGDGVSGVYIWGAQLEVGAFATSYNSTTPKNLLGFTEEFDNAAWTKSNSFVQTNLLTYSEAFDNAAWTKELSTVTADSIASPNNTTTADSLNGTNSGNASVYESKSVAASTTYTWSVYAKANTATWIAIGTFDGTVDIRQYFNLSTGTLGSSENGTITNATITNVGNGWYRCTCSRVTSVGATTARCQISLASADLTRTGVGSLYIWGAQLVQGATAGDYARTDSTTRAISYIAPNGFANAQKLVENTVNTFHYITPSGSPTISGTIYTGSIYAKAGERNWIALSARGITSGSAYFNLTTGVVGTKEVNIISSSIDSIGNGWYRCSIKYTAIATTNVMDVLLSSANGTVSYTGDGTSGIYIYGSQLSNSASLDPYVYNPAAALTSVAYYAPRFTYDPVTLAPQGLLIEEARTNLATYSEDLTNAAWTKSNATISANAVAAPDGLTTADKIVEDTANTLHRAYETITLTAVPYTFTFYAKAAGRNWVYAGLTTGTASYAYFDLANGVVGTVNAVYTSSSITKMNNGWYRCSITRTATAASWYPEIGTATADNTNSFIGDGSSGIYVWGAQVEAGAFATSYIPTSASSVTRAADVAVVQGNNFANWYNPNEGSYFVNANPKALGGNVLIFSDGTGQNFMGTAAFTSAHLSVTTVGVSVANIDVGTYVVNKSSKLAAAYKNNDFAVSLDNSPVGVDTSGNVPFVNKLNIAASVTGSGSFLNGTISQINYYNKKLSDNQLVALTA